MTAPRFQARRHFGFSGGAGTPLKLDASGIAGCALPLVDNG
jgi:hypothetical protein